MSLKRLAGWGSFFLLFYLLAGYSRFIFGEVREDMLVCVWNSTFCRLNGECIYWIALRLTAWIMIYLRLLRLESGFSVYLFLRRRSYWEIFFHTYAECFGIMLCYYGLGTLLMAVCLGGASAGAGAGLLLGQAGLFRILAEEGLEALSFCLAAYAVHCAVRRAEAGFIAVLVSRLLLNFITGGRRPELPVQAVVNLVMAGLVFGIAFYDFTEKWIDGR